MVFFYSEPLVDKIKQKDKDKKGDMIIANDSETLQTELEYMRLTQDLLFTQKEFKIDKHPINVDSFT